MIEDVSIHPERPDSHLVLSSNHKDVSIAYNYFNARLINLAAVKMTLAIKFTSTLYDQHFNLERDTWCIFI